MANTLNPKSITEINIGDYAIRGYWYSDGSFHASRHPITELDNRYETVVGMISKIYPGIECVKIDLPSGGSLFHTCRLKIMTPSEYAQMVFEM